MNIEFIDLGLCSYEKSFQIQNEYHELVAKQNGLAKILLLEHPTVATLGKHGSTEFIKDLRYFEKNAIPVIRTDRGGEITIHMPGQLVVYPIIPLMQMKIGVKEFVHKIEQVVIDLLNQYSIKSNRDRINPGVWVDENKICAIGIRVKNRVSMHGLALNVCNDLSVFDTVVPCGIKNRGVTNMVRAWKAHKSGPIPEIETVKIDFKNAWMAAFAP